MLKIEKLMLNAVNSKSDFNLKDTSVSFDDVGYSYIRLNNILIATIDHNNGSKVIHNFDKFPVGGSTRTAHSRLRALDINENIKQCKYTRGL